MLGHKDLSWTMVLRWTRSLLSLLAIACPARAFRPSPNANSNRLLRTATANTRGAFLNKLSFTTTSKTTSISMSTVTEDAGAATVIPGRPTWQQTMLRIKDPAKRVKFYTEQLGFTLIDSLYFSAIQV
jgi:hypothetical protein